MSALDRLLIKAYGTKSARQAPRPTELEVGAVAVSAASDDGHGHPWHAGLEGLTTELLVTSGTSVRFDEPAPLAPPVVVTGHSGVAGGMPAAGFDHAAPAHAPAVAAQPPRSGPALDTAIDQAGQDGPPPPHLAPPAAHLPQQVDAARAAPAPPAAETGSPPEEGGSSAPAAGPRMTWLAQWEVDRFRWSEICDRLTRTIGADLDRIVEQFLALRPQAGNVLAVTSFARGEGRTTLTLCLARVAAARGVSVVVVDADLEKPRLAERLGMVITSGWEQVLAGRQAVGEVCIASLEDRITVLPLKDRGADRAGDPHRQAAESLGRLSESFDLVLVDAGPVSLATASGLLGPVAGQPVSAVLVQDQRFTTQTQMHESLERLHQAGLQPLGVAKNFVPEQARGTRLPGTAPAPSTAEPSVSRSY
jgi:Mrp family chromosome partitioning ATPase